MDAWTAVRVDDSRPAPHANPADRREEGEGSILLGEHIDSRAPRGRFGKRSLVGENRETVVESSHLIANRPGAPMS